MDKIELIQKGLLTYELIQNDLNNYYSAYDKISFSAVLYPKVEPVVNEMELVFTFVDSDRLNQPSAPWRAKAVLPKKEARGIMMKCK
jgi:hypothetical protein